MNDAILDRARSHLRQAGIDAWAVCDFRGNNPVLAPVLGRRPHTTRRVVLVVPVAGPPTLLAHAIEAGQFAAEADRVRTFRSHAELTAALRAALAGARTVAVEYSPGGLLPAVSWVDAGTVELLRGLGVDRVVSSADLLQAALAVWSPEAVAGHREASAAVAAAKDAAFAAIGEALATGRAITELDVQGRIGEQLAAGGFETDHPAIVGVNAHSADPHYAPTPAAAAPVCRGDWVLVDLWARRPGDSHVFADITWVACAAPRVEARRARVFDTVRRTRDLIMERLTAGWSRGEPLQGWQLDRLARETIAAAGYGDRLLHRTGHSLSPGPAVHGLGANLDDVESRDTRTLLPGTGFTIEPGVYLPDFGVRLEVNVYLDPQRGPTLTSPVQDAVVLL